MGKRRLSRAGKLAFMASILGVVGPSILYVGNLHAEARIVYEDKPVKIEGIVEIQSLKSMDVKQGTTLIKTCTYPDESSLCNGIEMQSNALYRNQNLHSGTFSEQGFSPYQYEIHYLDHANVEQTSVLQIERQSGSAIQDFPSLSLRVGENELTISGSYNKVKFTSDDPEHVQFLDGNLVRIKEGGKETVQITASDDGDANHSGGSRSTSFRVVPIQPVVPIAQASISEEVEEEEPMGRAMRYSTRSIEPTQNDWHSNVWTKQVRVELNNDNDQFTNDFNDPDVEYPDHDKVKLQAQFVNIEEEEIPYEKEDLKTLSKEQINTIFAGKTWIDQESLVTDKNFYVEPSETYNGTNTKTWIQDLGITYPQDDGIYLLRYRLQNTRSDLTIPMCVKWNRDEGGNPTTCAEGTSQEEQAIVARGYFDHKEIIGQDSSAPSINIKAKRYGESTWHPLVDRESLGEQAELKIESNGDIIGLEESKYQFVSRGSNIDPTKWNHVPGSGVLPVPSKFEGNIHVQASDRMLVVEQGEEVNRKAVMQRSITKAADDYVIVSLPVNNNQWQNLTSTTVGIVEPSITNVSYDGVLVRFTSNTRATYPDVYLAKSEFENGLAPLQLPNGDYTIKASVVTRNGSNYTDVDARSIATSNLKIDHSASISASKGAKQGSSYPITLTTSSGPSGIRKVQRIWKNTGVADVVTTLVANQDGYRDLIYANGSYTYTIENNAGVKASTQPIVINDLQSNDPILVISGVDQLGNPITSGETAQEYVTIKAEDRNLNSDPDKHIEVCITPKGGSMECKDYTLNTGIKVSEDAVVRFREKNNPSNVYGEFDVKIESSSTLGTVVIERANEYTNTAWYGEDQLLQATLQGGIDTAVLEHRIDHGDWITSNGKSIQIPVPQGSETSGRHRVEVRSSYESTKSEIKAVSVNIDKVTPTLSLTKQAQSTSGIPIAFHIQVGESGIHSASVNNALKTLSLDSYIEGNTLRNYVVNKNANYTFSITNKVGKSAQAKIKIEEFEDNSIEVTSILIKDGKETAYDGQWTNGNVRVELSSPLEMVSYEMSLDNKATWRACEDVLNFDQDQDTNVYFRVVKNGGQKVESGFTQSIRIDKVAPSNPLITFTTLNKSRLTDFLNAITFDLYSNAAQEAAIEASDDRSGCTLYYQEAQSDGSYDQDFNHSAWKKYEKALRFDEEGRVQLYAYALDGAGNYSDMIDSDAILYDFTPPLLYGMKPEESYGYIPRKITYEDKLSGMNDEASSLSLQEQAVPLQQEMLIKEVGNYSFTLFDKANNQLQKDFILKKIPDPEDMDGSDEEKEIIDEIEKEFEEHEDDMDDKTKEDIGQQIEDMKDAHNKQRVDFLEDKENGSRLVGVEGTTFAKDSILEVRNITNQLESNEFSTYQTQTSTSNETLRLNDVYEVRLLKDGKAIPLLGKADLRMSYDKKVDEVAYLDDSYLKLEFSASYQLLQVQIEETGRYSCASEETKGSDQLGDPPFTSFVNTGDDSALYSYVYVTVLASVALCIIFKIKRKRRNDYE